MQITSFYPVIMTGDVGATADFYKTYFGFTEMFSCDWYVHLQFAGNADVNLAVLDGAHETIPQSGRGRASGLLLNFEVEDADAVYATARAAGLPILQALRDEAFGQRQGCHSVAGGASAPCTAAKAGANLGAAPSAATSASAPAGGSVVRRTASWTKR